MESGKRETQSKREHLTLLFNLELPWVTHGALTLSWKDFGRKERNIVGLLVLVFTSVSLPFIHNLVFTLLGHLPHSTTEEKGRAWQTYLCHNNFQPQQVPTLKSEQLGKYFSVLSSIQGGSQENSKNNDERELKATDPQRNTVKLCKRQ